MRKSDAQISISVLVYCPYCEEIIDLMDLQYLNDDGYIYSQILSKESFGKENWNEVIECPDCKKEFIVENVNW